MNKKILILSNACLSQTDSNGRTLAKLFQAFDRGQLAQFFVYGTPDFSICDTYYQVSDRDALQSFLRQRPYGGVVSQKNDNVPTASSPPSAKKISKTPFSMLLREIAWKFGRWMSKDFFAWVDTFSPDAIVIFLADNVFLERLARRIAKAKRIPIYVYSTEDYVFKNYNYLTKRPSAFYWLFYYWLNREYQKLTPYVHSGIFNTPLLADLYQKRYSYPCTCVFNRSDIEFISKEVIHGPVKISYLGNMGVNRHVPLIELADLLAEIVPGTKLDVYGKLPSDEAAAKAIVECKTIRYCGFVSYEEVTRVIHESTLLVHVEQNDDFYSRDLKYAFSTKIADSVCSGTPLLVYARRDLAGTDFLTRNQCAFIAETKEELRAELARALFDEPARKTVLDAAKQTKEKYLSQNDALYRIIAEK